MRTGIIAGEKSGLKSSLRSEDGVSGSGEDSGSISSASPNGWSSDSTISPLRKAAIVLVSLDQSLASRLLSYLERSAVEAVTREFARVESIAPGDRKAVLEEFFDLVLSRLCFDFDDLVAMHDSEIRAIFQEVDLHTWALALTGAAEVVRSKVLRALSSSMAHRLRFQLDRVGPFRLSGSETAQREITERLRRLGAYGRVGPSEPSNHEVEG